MVKIDLITGFLGAGKTTFIKKYASYFIKQGQTIGILENDYMDPIIVDNCEIIGKVIGIIRIDNSGL